MPSCRSRVPLDVALAKGVVTIQTDSYTSPP